MRVTVHNERVFALLDVLLARWKKKQFPYNKKDAVIPQTIIPEDLKADKKALTTFYFYTCIYMRGGIRSLQAFNALLRMREAHPTLFDPIQAQWMKAEDIQPILKEHIGWDSKAASQNWIENSRRLAWDWGGNPLELFKGIGDWDEALRRLRNKRTKRDQVQAGPDGRGFMGFQPKMVSMLIYFFDWEGLLDSRFLYPTPADFHNFRLGLTTGGLEVFTDREFVRSAERLSAPWRHAVMAYLRERKADPVELADALWLFSLVMCGNSPLTRVRKIKNDPERPIMFSGDALPHRTNDAAYYLQPRFRKKLAETCLRCPIMTSCTLAIPERPYYQEGQLVLGTRFRVEDHLPTIDPDLPPPQVKIALENLLLLGPVTS